MVKWLCVIFMFSASFVFYGQNLSLGVGARVNGNRVNNQTKFNFDILNINGDTLKLNANKNSANLNNGLSFPIYARCTSKGNWWVQLNYGYEIWRLEINAFSKPTSQYVQNIVTSKINELPNAYTVDEIEELREVYTEDVIEDATVEMNSFERVQYNKLSLAIGSTVNRKGIVKFYYGFGFDLYSASTFESYQGFVYDNDEVERLHEVLDDLPKLNAILFSPFVNFGIEKQNLRMGLDFTFYSSPAFGKHAQQNFNTTQLNDFSSQFIQDIISVGVSLNYSLFNQNFNQVISPDKKNVLDPVVIGRYQEKPKRLQYGLSLNFPNFHNSGWSVIDGLELSNEDDIVLYNDSLMVKNDSYLSGVLFMDNNKQGYAEILDYIYLEKQDETIFINDNDELDTNFLSTTIFFDWGNINSIVISPKLSGFVRLNPHELFATEFNVGYQNHTYGIVAYETERETTNGETTIQTRKLVYQENFHELSLGLNACFQKPFNNISQMGFHIGLNYNLWFNGIFQTEKGGINDSELLEDFHDYFTGQKEGQNDPNFEESEEWNANINNDADKGIFTKQNYYNYNYNGQSNAESYHMDFSPYLFNTLQNRSYLELRLGVDYYIENLKFNVYAERSIRRNNTMYNNLFAVGMGVSLFLN